MRPIVSSFQYLGGLRDAKMARESATMELPNEEVACGSGGDTKAVAEEEEAGVNPILRIISGTVHDLGPVIAEIQAILIDERKAIKPGNGRL